MRSATVIRVIAMVAIEVPPYFIRPENFGKKSVAPVLKKVYFSFFYFQKFIRLKKEQILKLGEQKTQSLSSATAELAK